MYGIVAKARKRNASRGAPRCGKQVPGNRGDAGTDWGTATIAFEHGVRLAGVVRPPGKAPNRDIRYHIVATTQRP
jgi:hypothetical protein